MAYNPKTWKDDEVGQTPIKASDLNHIEQGIANAVEKNSDAMVTNVVSRNLLNLLETSNVANNVTINNIKTNSITITATSTTYARVNVNVHLKAGTYTLSGMYKLLSGSETNLKSNTVLIFSDSNQIAEGNLSKLTFALSEEKDIEIRLLLFTTTTGTVGTQVQFYNLQIEQDTSKTTFTPYLNLQELQEYSSINNYSTEEQIIGKWINGKTLYRKVIVYTGTFNFYTNVSHNIANLDELVNVNGKYKITSGNTRTIPSAYSNTGTLNINNFYCFIYDISTTSVGVCLSQFVIDNIEKLTLTLEYTKTSD